MALWINADGSMAQPDDQGWYRDCYFCVDSTRFYFLNKEGNLVYIYDSEIPAAVKMAALILKET